MPITLVQTDDASDLAPFDYCGGLLDDAAPAQAGVVGGTAGSSAVSITCDNGLKDVTISYLNVFSESGVPNSTAWEAGNWTLRTEITTADMDLTDLDCCVRRVNSAGVNQQTIILVADLGDATTTGVKSVTAAGTSADASATDRILVDYLVFNANNMGDTFAFSPSQNIDTPVNQGGAPAADNTPPLRMLMGVGLSLAAFVRPFAPFQSVSKSA